jgi:5,10-methylenetetrahydromethanopterin reductase
LIDEGAKKAGRRVEDLDRPQLIVCSVDAEREKALDRTREFLTRALAHQPQVATDWGMPEKLLHQIQGILGAPGVPDRVQRAKPLLPEELVERITASGTPLEARRKVAQYQKRGCTCPVLDPVGSDVRLLIETFAPGSGGERQH